MVQRVVGRTIDDVFKWMPRNHLKMIMSSKATCVREAWTYVRVMDEDRPEVDEHEEAQVEFAVEGDEVDEEVVGHRLEVAIERVERVGREGSGNYRANFALITYEVAEARQRRHTEPFVVGLVKPLVANGVVLPSVNPVDAIVGEDEVAEDVVNVSITSNFCMGQKTYNRMERAK